MGSRPEQLDLPRGVTIRRHASGEESIQIAFTYKGQQCRETLRGRKPTKSNLTYANNFLCKIRLEIAEGKFDYASQFPGSKKAASLQKIASGTYTIGELMNDYLSRRAGVIEMSTWKAEESMSRAQIVPGLGKILVRELTTDQIIAWIRSSLVGLSLKYIRNVMTPLRQALYQAIADGVRSDNPASSAVLSTKAHVPKKNWISEAGPDPLTTTEIDLLLNACSSLCVRNLFEVAFATGMRSGELIALKWSDVDVKAAKLTVRRAIVDAHEKGTKTWKGKRIIDLSTKAIEALQSQHEITAKSVRVFCHPRTELPLRKSQQIRLLWISAVEKAEIRYRKPYQTRHTYASQMISRPGGVNLFYLADQLGHEGIEMINRHYGRWIRDNERRACGDKS